MPNCRNPNSLITIQRLPLKASNAHHMSMCLKFALYTIYQRLCSWPSNWHPWGLQKLGPSQMENPIVLWMSWVPGDIHSSMYLEKNDLVVVLACCITQAWKSKRVDCNSYASFEYLEVKLHTASTVVRIAVVYWPPSSKVNKLLPSSLTISTICLNTSQFPLVGFWS